jgi:hypothetical protein
VLAVCSATPVNTVSLACDAPLWRMRLIRFGMRPAVFTVVLVVCALGTDADLLSVFINT